MRRPPARQGANLLFPLSLGGPPLVWQLLFFVVPFGFLIAVTFWSVRNFRLTPDFITGNWVHIVGAGFFRGAYAYTFILAAMTAILASLIAFRRRTPHPRRVEHVNRTNRKKAAGNHWPRAAVIAVVMVVTLTVVLGVMLGLAYGQKGRRRA
jgi:ABC-type spermidine/putrescine transport system permease subunit I